MNTLVNKDAFNIITSFFFHNPNMLGSMRLTCQLWRKRISITQLIKAWEYKCTIGRAWKCDECIRYNKIKNLFCRTELRNRLITSFPDSLKTLRCNSYIRFICLLNQDPYDIFAQYSKPMTKYICTDCYNRIQKKMLKKALKGCSC